MQLADAPLDALATFRPRGHLLSKPRMPCHRPNATRLTGYHLRSCSKRGALSRCEVLQPRRCCRHGERSHGSVSPPTNFNRRTSRTWRMVVLSAGTPRSSLASQGNGPESASRRTSIPERHRMTGDIISEQRVDSFRPRQRGSIPSSLCRKRPGIGTA